MRLPVRWIFALYWTATAALFAVMLVRVFWFTPIELTMGPVQKIFYLHLPSAINTFGVEELLDALFTVLDGEIMAWREDRPLPFSLLQTRIGRKKPGRVTLEKAPVAMLAYDCLEFGGRDMRSAAQAVRRATLATTDGFAIYSGTKHPEAAWELMKFLISQDYGRAMARAHFLQPARASLVPDWIDYIRQEFPEKAKDVDISAFADGHIKGYSVTTEIFPNMLQAGEIAREAWDEIFTLGQAPVSKMQQVCQQIEALQKSSGTLPAACECSEENI